jgi:hypothetical protein
MRLAGRGYGRGMKLLRSAAVIGLARKAYTEAQKPQNQARIKEAVAKVQARRNGGAGSARARRP